jgi:acyl carrier protein
MTEVDTPDSAVDANLRAEIVGGICALLPRVLKREVEGATEQTALMEALGMSSTSALEVVLELEDRLGQAIAIEDLGREDFATVGTLADYIAANLLPEED